MGALRQLILNRHPTTCFCLAEFVLASLSLGPSPRFIPLVLLLSVLRLHGQRVVCRSTRILELTYSWLVVTIGSSMAHWTAASQALSSPSQSIWAITTLSAITYLCAIVALYGEIRCTGRLNSIWSEHTLFPALWVMLWAIVSHCSPVGRLLNWSPVSTSHSYNWIVPFFGPLAIDWIVAAWAVICSEVFALWLMGFEEYEPLHICHDTQLLSRKSRSLLTFVTLLLFLILPSYTSTDLPRRHDVLADATDFTVGCVLPHPRDGSYPTLSDFVTESATMTAAKVLLWPESAVVFHSHKEREAAFALVRDKIRGPYVGVAFEEYVVEDPSRPSSSRTRNGLAIVHKDQQPGDEVVQYYKRNLVPFTESFSKIPSIDPPVISQLNVAHPKGIPAPEWAPPPTFKRPIPVTSSVCLDFASPSAFTGLTSRPALILGPARTWTTTVGLAMWDQATTRANELGSMVLWCDGGLTGVSGVGGGGIHEIMQVGGGSWTRTVAVPYPFNDSRTIYMKLGDSTIVAFLLALVGGGFAGTYLVKAASRATVATVAGGRVALQKIPFVRRMIASPAGPVEADLLGIHGERQNLLR